MFPGGFREGSLGIPQSFLHGEMTTLRFPGFPVPGNQRKLYVPYAFLIESPRFSIFLHLESIRKLLVSPDF